VERLRTDPRFQVEVAGRSLGGIPIFHVRFGEGSTKALYVAGNHCMEPIGGLTSYSLLNLLHQNHSELAGADVEWHIVPCIDPDGALLNEGWTQKPFALEHFMRNFYLQPLRDGVDTSFPVTYKNLSINNEPSHEAKILAKLLDAIKPDFYAALHNTFAGGAFFFSSRDIGAQCYAEIHDLLRRYNFPLRAKPQYSEFLRSFGQGVVEMHSVVKHYDFLARTLPNPEEVLGGHGYGGASWDYLEQIKPDALIFVPEMGYFQHPSYESDRQTGRNLRQFKLRIEADSKFVAAVMLQEWEKVKQDLDPASPLYKAMEGLALPSRDTIMAGGWPVSRYPSRDTLFNPEYDRHMTEGEQFDACIVNDGLKFLAFDYQFLRLLEGSTRTPAVSRAIDRLEELFQAAFADIAGHFDLSRIEVFACDRLAAIQLGSSLVALNSVLGKGMS